MDKNESKKEIIKAYMASLGSKSWDAKRKKLTKDELSQMMREKVQKRWEKLN